jgi:hypothetical protein
MALGSAAMLFLLLPGQGSAAAECKVPDASFKTFLSRFEQELAFQYSRIIFPLVFRTGDYSMTEVEIKLLDLPKVKSEKDPWILSETARKAKGILETWPVLTPRYVEVFHKRPEADSYRVLYKFRRVEGCWYLEEIHDQGL